MLSGETALQWLETRSSSALPVLCRTQENSNFIFGRSRDAAGKRPHTNLDADVLFMGAQRAESRLRNARVLLAGAQNRRVEQIQPLKALGRHNSSKLLTASAQTRTESEMAELQTRSDDKQLTTVLLAVLETKAEIRNKRFAEIARLLEELQSVDIAYEFEWCLISFR